MKISELENLAAKFALWIQHDCGGYRIVDAKNRHVFPEGGICPTATKRECETFLKGVEYKQVKKNKVPFEPVSITIDSLENLKMVTNALDAGIVSVPSNTTKELRDRLRNLVDSHE